MNYAPAIQKQHWAHLMKFGLFFVCAFVVALFLLETKIKILDKHIY